MHREDPKAPYKGLPAFPARHFVWEEVRCHHCREHGEFGFPQRRILESEPFRLLCKILDGVRGYQGKPLIVTSWYRCEAHPFERKKKRGGVHTYGLAADMLLHGTDVLNALESILHTSRYHVDGGKWTQPLDVLGLGFNQKGEYRERYVHVDVGGCLPEYRRYRGAVWTY